MPFTIVWLRSTAGDLKAVGGFLSDTRTKMSPEVNVPLTRSTDYGLRAPIYLASLPQGKMASITAATDVYGVSCNHMAKLINLRAAPG